MRRLDEKSQYLYIPYTSYAWQNLKKEWNPHQMENSLKAWVFSLDCWIKLYGSTLHLNHKVGKLEFISNILPFEKKNPPHRRTYHNINLNRMSQRFVFNQRACWKCRDFQFWWAMKNSATFNQSQNGVWDKDHPCVVIAWKI